MYDTVLTKSESWLMGDLILLKINAQWTADEDVLVFWTNFNIDIIFGNLAQNHPNFKVGGVLEFSIDSLDVTR